MAKENVVLDADVEVKIGNQAWKGKLSDIARIELKNLNGELARQPELVSWFGVMSVEAVDVVESTKNKLAALKEDQETLYADLDLLMRQESTTTGKKTTEAEVKSLVSAHTRYKASIKEIQNKREELRMASVVLNKMNKILIALEHKRDMLIQLSANQRREFITGDYGHEGGSH